MTAAPVFEIHADVREGLLRLRVLRARTVVRSGSNLVMPSGEHPPNAEPQSGKISGPAKAMTMSRTGEGIFHSPVRRFSLSLSSLGGPRRLLFGQPMKFYRVRWRVCMSRVRPKIQFADIGISCPRSEP